jgi:hypothetical protein
VLTSTSAGRRPCCRRARIRAGCALRRWDWCAPGADSLLCNRYLRRQIEVFWPMITSIQTIAHCDRNIGVVATARKLVTNVYYGLRDGDIRALAKGAAYGVRHSGHVITTVLHSQSGSISPTVRSSRAGSRGHRSVPLITAGRWPLWEDHQRILTTPGRCGQRGPPQSAHGRRLAGQA